MKRPRVKTSFWQRITVLSLMIDKIFCLFFFFFTFKVLMILAWSSSLFSSSGPVDYQVFCDTCNVYSNANTYTVHAMPVQSPITEKFQISSKFCKNPTIFSSAPPPQIKSQMAIVATRSQQKCTIPEEKDSEEKQYSPDWKQLWLVSRVNRKVITYGVRAKEQKNSVV